jgi:hypothetical protein
VENGVLETIQKEMVMAQIEVLILEFAWSEKNDQKNISQDSLCLD